MTNMRAALIVGVVVLGALIPLAAGQGLTFRWVFGDPNAPSGNNISAASGVFSPYNLPSQRATLGALWRDTLNTDNIWMFGSSGSNKLNDLWVYSVSLAEWAFIRCATAPVCMDLSLTAGAEGVQGPWIPIRRGQPVTWASVTEPGIAYMFSGSYDNSASTILDDQWMFNSSTASWAWFKKQGTTSDNGNSLNLASSSYSVDNYPGGRFGAGAWVGNNGVMYMFGGLRSSAGLLCDLWALRHNSTHRFQWKRLFPNDLTTAANEATGTCPTGSSAQPRARYYTGGFQSANNLYAWIYGGAIDSCGSSDLWRFNMSSRTWARMAGSSSYSSCNNVPAAGQYYPVYGSLGSSTGYPGSRTGAVILPSPEPDIQYLTSGGTCDIATNNYVLASDWFMIDVRDVNTPAFTWMGGPKTHNMGLDGLGVKGGIFQPDVVYPSTCFMAAVQDPASAFVYNLMFGKGNTFTLNIGMQVAIFDFEFTDQPVTQFCGLLATQPSLYAFMVPKNFNFPVATSTNVAIGLTIATGPASAISGNLVPVVNGTAQFTSLAIMSPGTYTLTATAHFGTYQITHASTVFKLLCWSGCLTCTGPGLSATNCQQCDTASSYVMASDGSGCTATCGTHEFKDFSQAIPTCSACTSGCMYCIGAGLTQANCQRCGPGYVRGVDGICAQSCHMGQFLNATVGQESRCIVCTVGCSNCTSLGLAYPSECHACVSPGYLLSSDASQCITTCAPNEYKALTPVAGPAICTACTVGCASCQGPGLISNCLNCDEANGFVRSRTGQCVTNCSDGEYKDTTVSPQACQLCKPGCSTCVAYTSVCECDGTAGFAKDAAGDCVNPCPVGFAISATPPFSCDQVTCVVEESGYDVDPDCAGTTLAYNETCPMWCPAGYVGDTAVAMCGQTTVNAAGVFVGTPQCVVCPVGKYAPARASDCSACQNGVTAATGAGDVTDCYCLPGFYEEQRFSGVCVPCPDGAACGGVHDGPVSAPGYFESSQNFLACIPAVACPGNNTCTYGYEGFLCAKCRDGFYRLGSTCQPCTDTTLIKIGAGAVAAAFLCLAMIFLAIPLEYGQSGFAFASPSIMLAFVQVTATFLQIKLNWPEKLLGVLIAFSSLNLNLDLVNPECIATYTYYDELMVELLVPIVILVLFMIVFALWTTAVWYRSSDRRESLRRAKASFLMFAAGYLLFLSLVYNFESASALSYFSCRHLADGHNVLNSSPTTACYDDEWNRYLPLAVAGVVLYVVLVPALMGGVYVYLRRRHGADVARSHPLINFSVAKYREKHWYYETLVIIRKLAIVAVSTFVIEDVVASAMICSIILCVCLVLGVIVRPFAWGKHDFAEGISIFTSLLILSLGMLSTSSRFEAPQRAILDGIALSLVVVTMFILVVIFLLECWVRYQVYLIDRKSASVVGIWRGRGERPVGLLLVGEYLITAYRSVVTRDPADPATRMQPGLDPPEEASSEVSIVGAAALEENRFALITLDGIQVWDALTMTKLGEMQSPMGAGPITHFAAGPTWFATAHVDGALVAWSKPSGSLTQPSVICMIGEENHATSMTAVEGAVYIGLATGEIVRYDLDEAAGTLTLNGHWRTARGEMAAQLAVIPERELLLVASGFVVQAISMRTGEAVLNLPGHKGEACFVQVTPEHIVTGTWTGDLRVWNAENGQYITRFAGLRSAVRMIAVEGEVLYSAASDGHVFAWQIKASAPSENLDPIHVWWKRCTTRNRVGAGPALMEMVVRPGDDTSFDALTSTRRSRPRLLDSDEVTNPRQGTETMATLYGVDDDPTNSGEPDGDAAVVMLMPNRPVAKTP